MKANNEMTLAELQSLASTDEGREQIRVMVAEAAKWTKIGLYEGEATGVSWKGGRNPRTQRIDALPNYPTSLDACAEFEAGMRGKDLEWYEHHLERIVFKATTDDDWSEELGVSARTRSWHARALHRCMAFILTKTKGDE